MKIIKNNHHHLGTLAALHAQKVLAGLVRRIFFHIWAVAEDRFVALALRLPLHDFQSVRLGGIAWPSARPAGGRRGGRVRRRSSVRRRVPLCPRLRRDVDRHPVHSARGRDAL